MRASNKRCQKRTLNFISLKRSPDVSSVHSANDMIAYACPASTPFPGPTGPWYPPCRIAPPSGGVSRMHPMRVSPSVPLCATRVSHSSPLSAARRPAADANSYFRTGAPVMSRAAYLWERETRRAGEGGCVY